jgi:hypothetical protein
VLTCLADIKALIAELCEKIVLGDDSTALAEIIANLMQLCDKLLAQSDIQNEILAELQALCEKILAGNESLAEVVAELAALCEKLNTAIAELEALCEKIDNVTTTCPAGDAIPEADYTGGICWVTGRPTTGVPWALIDNRDPANQVTVASGSTFGEFIADMEALGYTEWSFGESHYFCPCPPGLENAGDYFVTADGDTVSKPPCVALAELPNAPDKVLAEETPALSTIDCNSDAILQALQDLCAKQNDPTTAPCLRCAVFSIAADEIVGNVITGVQGGNGQVEMLPEPATGPLEFATQIAALGYSVESVVGNLVTVCGSDLVFSYQQEDGTIVPANQITTRDGLLVCDPAGNAALCAKIDQLIGLQIVANDSLDDIKKCLCDCDDEDTPTCAPVVSSEANPDGWSWSTGPTANQPIEFPTPIDTPEPQDIIASISANCEELDACFGADCGPNIRLRFTFSHQQLGPNHTGFIFTVANGQAVAVSANNTAGATPSNGVAQQIGTASGDPDDTGYVDRWVEYLVPKDLLCGAGVQAASGGFQGFENAGVFDESLASITTTIQGCE